MGMAGEAKDYYIKSHKSNPDYVYPLCNLFLIYISKLGPSGAFERVREEGYLSTLRQAEILASLFFEAGYPGLACTCLEEAPPEAGVLSRNGLAPQLARYSIYAGRSDKALSLLENIAWESRKDDPYLAADEIVALLLTGDYSGAKKRALELWRQPGLRGRAWGLLNLVSITGNHSWCGYPGKDMEPAAIETVMAVLEKCMRICPPQPGGDTSPDNRGLGRLAQKAMEVLTRISPRSFKDLWDYLGDRATEVKQAMDGRFTSAGRLYQ